MLCGNSEGFGLGLGLGLGTPRLSPGEGTKDPTVDVEADAPVAAGLVADGGVLAGLPRPLALKLATQTVLGTAAMIAETQRHPGELKDAVASPGGTTIEAISVLEQNGIRGALIEAVAASAERSQEMGEDD